MEVLCEVNLSEAQPRKIARAMIHECSAGGEIVMLLLSLLFLFPPNHAILSNCTVGLVGIVGGVAFRPYDGH